ncbi:acyl-CoA dehydrogenase family protein [Muricoccus radiodurans]|uniref:acyl-CoA dehydrogenase family protein n=1 Tax=Muricoccus radiodurans TaxID=2231721 RepID=UPI003CF26C9E
MPFAATPLVGGDAFDTAARIAGEVDAEIGRAADTAAEAALLSRHWARIAELGWPATVIGEAAGGAEGSVTDLAALAGGAGRAALPLPVAGVCAVVPHLLGAAPDHPILTALAQGEARPCAILPDAAREPGTEPLGLADRGGSLVLAGGVVGVEMPPEPTHLVIVVGDVLLLLPADAEGIALATFQRMDRRLAGDWSFSGTPVGPESVLARGPEVLRRAEEARDFGALLTCVEATEAAGALIEQTVSYLSTRVQFGAPLGTNQALRHRVADMYVAYETLRGLVGAALRATEAAGRPAWRDIAFAKLRLGQAGRFIAESAIQCHGGMGMTDDLPATRLARRILMAEHEYGDRALHARRLLAAGH